jgi:hypothetical protein
VSLLQRLPRAPVVVTRTGQSRQSLRSHSSSQSRHLLSVDSLERRRLPERSHRSSLRSTPKPLVRSRRPPRGPVTTSSSFLPHRCATHRAASRHCLHVLAPCCCSRSCHPYCSIAILRARQCSGQPRGLGRHACQSGVAVGLVAL